MTPDPNSRLNEHVRRIWNAGIAAVSASQRIRDFVTVSPTHLGFGELSIAHSDYRDILVVGAGKACAGMAAGLEKTFGDKFYGMKQVTGQINVPDDQVANLKHIELVGCRPLGINLPTERVLDATQRIIDMVSQCHADDLCLVLLTGGGSALLEQPISPIRLCDFQSVTKLLSQGGASITELNAVRRQISRVKGGGLARLANCRRMITMMISDVIGDRLEVIASGPTLIQDSEATSAQRNAAATAVLEKYDPNFRNIPSAVLTVLRQPEPPPRPTTADTHVNHFIIANLEMAVQAAQRQAMDLGYVCLTEIDHSSERVESVARRLIQPLLSAENLSLEQPASSRPARCFISGGEPTVELCASPGRGGRNQQLVLAALRLILDSAKVDNGRFSMLSGGSDGEDGNVPVAGGIIDSQLVARLRRPLDDPTKLSRIQHALAHNDAFPLLQSWGCLLETGPTGTNVCDLRVLLYE